MQVPPAPSTVPIAIGMNARLFPSNWRPARQEIEFAREHGFEAIQLPGQEHSLDAARLGEPLAAVAEVLRAAGLTAVMEIVVRIDAAGRTTAGATPLAVLRANLPAIAALQCAYVHLHLAPLEAIEEGALQALEAGLAPEFAAGVELAKAEGFRLGLEHNEPWLRLFAAPEPCAALLAAVPGLGFVWDLNHTTPEHLTGYLALTPRMTMLHVADTPLPEVNHHLPLGQGAIDIAGYCRALLDSGFSGPAILEIGGLPKSGGYGRDTDAALIDSRRRLQAAILAAQSALAAPT